MGDTGKRQRKRERGREHCPGVRENEWGQSFWRTFFFSLAFSSADVGGLGGCLDPSVAETPGLVVLDTWV